MAPTLHTELDRIRRFLRTHQEKSTTRTRTWRWGSAQFHEALPLVYDLNFMRLEHPDDDATVEALVREADRVMGAMGHRQITIEDEELGSGLAPGFKDEGWNVNRHVVMVHRRSPDAPRLIDEVRVVEEPEVWPSRAEFLSTYEWCRDDQVLAQMHGAYRVWMRAGNGRDFAILRDGRAVSFAMLWMHDAVGQIEDVATLENYRNQGLSSAVVTRALQEARSVGCDLVFLIADEDDWPKQLYARLGFEPVGLFYTFVLTGGRTS